MTEKAQAFIAANALSPVVYGSVLTKHNRGADGPPDAVGAYYRLADGLIFKLTTTECRLVGYPRWAFET